MKPNWNTIGVVAAAVAVAALCHWLKVPVPPEVWALLSGTVAGMMPKMLGGAS